MRLSEHAKRLMIIHNFSGILRILIDTFFSIFILQTCGMNAMLFFYVIERLLLGGMFVFLSHTFSSKEYVVFYRISFFSFVTHISERIKFLSLSFSLDSRNRGRILLVFLQHHGT